MRTRFSPSMARVAAGLAGLVVAAGLAAAVPATADAAAPAVLATPMVHAQACSKARDIQVNHNAAGLRYVECHRGSGSNRQSSTALWLWDNKTDGKCAVGTVRIGSWHHTWTWCKTSQHSPKRISGWHRGADAKVYLSLDG